MIEPSPLTEITGVVAIRILQRELAPIAAGRPKPIVPSPPLVRCWRGRLKRQCCATHIWCWPTSQVTIGVSAPVSDSRFSKAGA